MYRDRPEIADPARGESYLDRRGVNQTRAVRMEDRSELKTDLAVDHLGEVWKWVVPGTAKVHGGHTSQKPAKRSGREGKDEIGSLMANVQNRPGTRLSCRRSPTVRLGESGQREVCREVKDGAAEFEVTVVVEIRVDEACETRARQNSAKYSNSSPRWAGIQIEARRLGLEAEFDNVRTRIPRPIE